VAEGTGASGGGDKWAHHPTAISGSQKGPDPLPQSNSFPAIFHRVPIVASCHRPGFVRSLTYVPNSALWARNDLGRLICALEIRGRSNHHFSLGICQRWTAEWCVLWCGEEGWPKAGRRPGLVEILAREVWLAPHLSQNSIW